jgi:hypothetical protein
MAADTHSVDARYGTHFQKKWTDLQELPCLTPARQFTFDSEECPSAEQRFLPAAQC